MTNVTVDANEVISVPLKAPHLQAVLVALGERPYKEVWEVINAINGAVQLHAIALVNSAIADVDPAKE
jgi:hypothetical protein